MTYRKRSKTCIHTLILDTDHTICDTDCAVPVTDHIIRDTDLLMDAGLSGFSYGKRKKGDLHLALLPETSYLCSSLKRKRLMKNTFYILIALVLLMVACGRPSGNVPLSADLQRAEDLMYPHPDSALHILQTMTPP